MELRYRLRLLSSPHLLQSTRLIVVNLLCDQLAVVRGRLLCSRMWVTNTHPSAEERSGFCGRELFWNGSDAACFSDHHFRVSSIRSYSRYHGVLIIHGVSTSARFAHPVFASVEAETDPLTDFPS